MNEIDTLTRGLERLGVTTPGAVQRLERYAREIRLWNSRIDLVADEDALVVRHLLDSLAVLPLLRAHGFLPPEAGGRACSDGGRIRMADVGSGAGLPGIPLAVALPEVRITLVERSGRRAGFLRSTVAILGLRNADVFHGDIRSFEAGSVDLCLFRALTGLTAEIVQSLRRVVYPPAETPGGRGRDNFTGEGGVPTVPTVPTGDASARGAVAYAGRRASAEDTADLLRGSFESVELVKVKVPFLDAERHVVIATGPAQ